jgi:mRNA-degrading endonuclease RelE of RelBE toxin-antitoxin system
LEKLQERDRVLVEETIERFAETGAGDVKLLSGTVREYRLRAGDWRIRFVYERSYIIRVLYIRNRKEAYR